MKPEAAKASGVPWMARTRGLWGSVRALARTTTFRVAMAFAGLFAGFAVLLLGYIYAATAGRLGVEADTAARSELNELAKVWTDGGARTLNMAVIERAARASEGLYVLVRPDGAILSGNIDGVPIDLARIARPPAGTALDVGRAVGVSFRYERPSFDGVGLVDRRARGLFLPGPDGYGLFVARDLGPGLEVADQVARVVFTGGAAVLGFALVGGYAAARQAASRVDELSRTARAVMAGDLTQRAAVRPAQPGEGDEFDALTEDMNSMLERIERLVTAARTTGDSIAHDLRSPLTRLRGRLESAAAHPGGEEVLRDALDSAVQDIDEVVATFNAVLRLSRLEAGEGGRLEVMDLGALAAELGEMFEPSIEAAGLAFILTPQDGLMLRGDRSLLAQALSNLLDNAIKYTPTGTVALSARRLMDGALEVAVADSGPGIAETDRVRAVERFVRLDSARSSPGSGIGLSLAAAVAELHGGRLELSEGLERSDGSGSGLRAAIVLPMSA